MTRKVKVKVYDRNGFIWVSGTINRIQHRKSTGYESTKRNFDFVSRDPLSVLLKLIDVKKEVDTNFIEYCIYSLNITKDKRNDSTQRDYESIITLHLKPYFKNFGIKDVNADTIELFLNDFSKKINLDTAKAYSSSTRRKALFIIENALSRAYRNNLIDKDYSKFVDKVKLQYEKIDIYTMDEMMTILQVSKGWLKVFLHLLFCSGARVGEILPIKKVDFDFEYNALYINKSISKGIVTGTNATKNHERIVVLPSYLIEMIKVFTEDMQIEDYVFTSKYGTCFTDAGAVTKGYFKPFVDQLKNVEYKTLKVFRHTASTILSSNGLSESFLQEQLGHTVGSNVTKKHYIQQTVSQHKKNEIDRIFNQELQLRKIA